MTNDYDLGGSALTDFKDAEKPSFKGAENFKERILRELAEASLQQQLQEDRVEKSDEDASKMGKASAASPSMSYQEITPQESLPESAKTSEQSLETQKNHMSSGLVSRNDKVLEEFKAEFSDALQGSSKGKQADRLSTLDHLEAKNEAVLAQLEAKESITEEKEPAMSRRQKNHKIAAKITSILVTIIVSITLLTAVFGYRYVASALGAVDPNAKQFVTVEIPGGSGNKLIGQILRDNGLIKNASIFNYYTRFKNISNLKSGYYNLQKSMTVKDITDALKQGGTAEPQAPVSGKILVKEGDTIDQIAQAVTVNVNTKALDKTPYSKQDFLDLMNNQDFIAKMVQKYPELLKGIPSVDQARYQLEGYLFPATYNYYEESTLEEIVEQMLMTMDTHMAPYYAQIAARGQSVNAILTLASLVEKEGSTDDDRRSIASVFYNRLGIQMPLQSNIAILYAMGKLGQETTLREDATIDTKIKSPYNIYENPGLMPGPVANPGLSAIEATINPANTDFLYFVADVTTGNVYYAEDYETHEANVSKYVNAHLAKD